MITVVGGSIISRTSSRARARLEIDEPRTVARPRRRAGESKKATSRVRSARRASCRRKSAIGKWYALPLFTSGTYHRQSIARLILRTSHGCGVKGRRAPRSLPASCRILHAIFCAAAAISSLLRARRLLRASFLVARHLDMNSRGYTSTCQPSPICHAAFLIERESRLPCRRRAATSSAYEHLPVALATSPAFSCGEIAI